MTNPNPVAPKTDTPAIQELPPPDAKECFERLREITADMSGEIEAFGGACDADRMDATFYLSTLESTLAAERASRLQAEEALSAITRITEMYIEGLSKPSVSPEQAEESR